MNVFNRISNLKLIKPHLEMMYSTWQPQQAYCRGTGGCPRPKCRGPATEIQNENSYDNISIHVAAFLTLVILYEKSMYEGKGKSIENDHLIDNHVL